MAHDEDLADRIRELVGGEPGWTEKSSAATQAVMRGRPMPGWLRVEPARSRVRTR